eukprot:6192061-Pleurochrysis_carterae.AAC.6
MPRLDCSQMGRERAHAALAYQHPEECVPLALRGRAVSAQQLALRITQSADATAVADGGIAIAPPPASAPASPVPSANSAAAAGGPTATATPCAALLTWAMAACSRDAKEALSRAAAASHASASRASLKSSRNALQQRPTSPRKWTSAIPTIASYTSPIFFTTQHRAQSQPLLQLSSMGPLFSTAHDASSGRCDSCASSNSSKNGRRASRLSNLRARQAASARLDTRTERAVVSAPSWSRVCRSATSTETQHCSTASPRNSRRWKGAPPLQRAHCVSRPSGSGGEPDCPSAGKAAMRRCRSSRSACTFPFTPKRSKVGSGKLPETVPAAVLKAANVEVSAAAMTSAQLFPSACGSMCASKNALAAPSAAEIAAGESES